MNRSLSFQKICESNLSVIHNILSWTLNAWFFKYAQYGFPLPACAGKRFVEMTMIEYIRAKSLSRKSSEAALSGISLYIRGNDHYAN
jgi:hypothetical protein